MCDAECDAVSESDRVFEREVVSEFDADCVAEGEYVSEAVGEVDDDCDTVSECVDVGDSLAVRECDGENVDECDKSDCEFVGVGERDRGVWEAVCDPEGIVAVVNVSEALLLVDSVGEIEGRDSDAESEGVSVVVSDWEFELVCVRDARESDCEYDGVGDAAESVTEALLVVEREAVTLIDSEDVSELECVVVTLSEGDGEAVADGEAEGLFDPEKVTVDDPVG